MALMFLLPFLLFATVMLVLSVAVIAEARGRRAGEDDAFDHGISILTIPTRAKFDAISIADAFHPDSAVLWQTQIPVLELVRKADAQGLQVDKLRKHYAQLSRRFPELYEGSSFKAWLRFLEEDAQLIEWTGSVVRITETGAEFLECRLSADAVFPSVVGSNRPSL